MSAFSQTPCKDQYEKLANAENIEKVPSAWKMTNEKAVEYWKNELLPITKFFRKGDAAAQTQMNDGLLAKMPPRLQSIVDNSFSCLDVAYCLTKQGVRLGFAPAFVLWDTAVTPTKMLVKSVQLGKKAEITEQEVKKILLIPTEIIYKNTPYIIGYSAMTAVGYNIPSIIDNASTTYLKDLEQAVPTVDDFKKDELMVVILPKGEEELGEKSSSYIVSQRKFKNKLWEKNVERMVVSTPEELVEKLGHVRNKGRIKELVIVAHGAAGEFDLQSSGLHDLVHPSKIFQKKGVFNQKKMETLSSKIKQWPKDLFAENARINLISCEVAKGKEGKQFVKNMASLMLQNGGSFIASPRSVSADPRLNRESGRNEQIISGNRMIDGLFYHAAVVPLNFIMSGLGPGIVYDMVTGAYSQDSVQVIQVKNEDK